MALFTPEELEELRRADEELDAEFVQSQEEIEASRNRDREARLDGLDNRGRKIADYQAAYRAANKDKIAERSAAYYAANKDKIADYRNNNRDAYNAYMREYMRRYRQRKKEICGAV